MKTKMNSNLWLAGLKIFGGLMVSGMLTLGCSEQRAAQSVSPETKQLAPLQPAKSKPLTQNKANSGTSSHDPAINIPVKPIDAEQFPKPANAESPMYNSDTRTVMFHQKGTVVDQAKFYADELGKLGWKKEASSEISDGVGFFDFTSGDLAITITINPLREGMITTIAQGSGIHVAKSLDGINDGDDDPGDDDPGDDDPDDNDPDGGVVIEAGQQ